jgi:hypothetical protein
MCLTMATGTGDEHVLSDDVEGERGVCGVPERIEDGGGAVVDVVGKGEHVVGGQNDVLGESPGSGDTQSEVVPAVVAATAPAVAAVAAGDVTFTRDTRTDRKALHVVTVPGHHPGELVTDDHGRRDRGGRPRIPRPDVQVGSADRREGDPDEDVVGADVRLGLVPQFQARVRPGLDQRFHGTTPNSRPTSTNASMAMSTCSGL